MAVRSQAVQSPPPQLFIPPLASGYSNQAIMHSHRLGRALSKRARSGARAANQAMRAASRASSAAMLLVSLAPRRRRLRGSSMTRVTPMPSPVQPAPAYSFAATGHVSLLLAGQCAAMHSHCMLVLVAKVDAGAYLPVQPMSGATCVRRARAPTASSCCAARTEAAPAAEPIEAGVKARLVMAAADGAASSDGSWLRSSRSHTSSTPSSRPVKRTAALRKHDVRGQVSRHGAWQGGRLSQDIRLFHCDQSHKTVLTRDCWACISFMCALRPMSLIGRCTDTGNATGMCEVCVMCHDTNCTGAAPGRVGLQAAALYCAGAAGDCSSGALVPSRQTAHVHAPALNRTSSWNGERCSAAAPPACTRTDGGALASSPSAPACRRNTMNTDCTLPDGASPDARPCRLKGAKRWRYADNACCQHAARLQRG